MSQYTYCIVTGGLVWMVLYRNTIDCIVTEPGHGLYCNTVTVPRHGAGWARRLGAQAGRHGSAGTGRHRSASVGRRGLWARGRRWARGRDTRRRGALRHDS